MIPSLADMERKHGTSATLHACREFIKSHKREKAVLRNIERGKAPKGSARKSTYLKTRRECDKAFSDMIRRDYSDRNGAHCYLHEIAYAKYVELPVKCGGKIVCFHLIPKADKVGEKLRFDKDNAIAACSSANFHEMRHRGDWEKIFEQLFPERMARLREKAKWPCKRNEASLRAMIAEFNRR